MLRTWGFDLATGDVLSIDNVERGALHDPRPARHVAELGLARRNRRKVFFWTNAWNIPPTTRSATTTVHVVFTLESGKTGTYDYAITIIP